MWAQSLSNNAGCPRWPVKQRSVMAVTALILLMLSADSHAANATSPEACMVEVMDPPATLVVRYDVFSGGPAIESVPLRLRNLSARDCVVQFEQQGGRETGFRLAESGIRTELFVLAPAAGVSGRLGVSPLAIRLPAGTDQRIELGVRLEPGAFPRPGNYSEELLFRLRDRATGRILDDELRTRLVVEVVPRAQVNVAGSRGRYGTVPSLDLIDFGRLETGLEREVYVQIRANNAYDISVRSENQWQLRLTERPSLPGIPYTVTLDGHTTRSGPLRLQRPRPRSPAGEVLPMRVRIGEVEGRFAGKYRDVVHVSVTALY